MGVEGTSFQAAVTGFVSPLAGSQGRGPRWNMVFPATPVATVSMGSMKLFSTPNIYSGLSIKLD